MPTFQIPRITDFPTQASDPASYAELPEGWSMAVADVVGSTVLAGQGRDRTVNFVAGSVVAVLSEVLGTADDPAVCQFGGDGAAAVPPGAEEGVRRALGALAYWAEASLGVSLRVGLVPVAALRAEGGGAIISGTARSDAATMTCLVGDFSSDRHVHFVDGSGLGFWRAATALKAKRAISTANPVQGAPVPVTSPA